MKLGAFYDDVCFQRTYVNSDKNHSSLKGSKQNFLWNSIRKSLLALSLAVSGTVSASTVFLSDFNGTDSQTYNDDSIRTLVEGWTGQRNPAGDHGGSFGYSDISGGVLSYLGGQGNASDALFIDHALTGVPVEYMLEARFRRDGSHSNSRTDFRIDLGDTIYIVGSGSSNNTGISGGATTPFSLTTSTWYFFEAINTSTSNEIRIWADGDTRPTSPLVTGAPSLLAAATVGLVGDNFSAPQRSVDFISISTLTSVPLPPAIWLFSSGLLGFIGVAKRKKRTRE